MPLTASNIRMPDFAFDPRWHRAAVWFLVITTLLRMCQLPSMELAPDEAYYWDWSRRPALGYYDQGPFIAYLIRATTAVFGTNEFGVRFGVLLASFGTLVCCYLLAKRLFSPLTGFLAVLLLGCTPLMEVGSLIATYDPPLVFFWALTVLLLERALFADDARRQNLYWLLVGVSTGLGFLSKHTMLLILPCLVLFLLLSPRHRFWLLRPQPYLALLIVLLLYSGVLVWNAQHHWWTFGHLRYLTHKSSDAPLKRLGDFVGSQALLVGPILFFGTLAASVWALRAGGLKLADVRGGMGKEGAGRSASVSGEEPTAPDTRLLFLLLMGLPVFLFFCLMTFRAKAQGNWAAFAWLTPTILWSAWLTEWAGRARKAAGRLAGFAALTGLVLTLLLIFPALRYALGVHLPPDADTSNTAYGWREMARHVQQTREEMGQGGRNPVFLVGNGYQYCALLAFYLPDHPRVQDMFLHFRLTMYAAYVEELKDHLGQDAIFVNDTQAEDRDLRALFERVEWEAPLPIYRRPYYSEPIHTLYIARCYHYRRYIGTDWHEGG